MRAYLLALICAFALVAESTAANSNWLAWRSFKRQHEKSYGQEEEAARFANFLANKELVERHNADPKAGFQMELNHMADWSKEEFDRLNGFKVGDMRRKAEQSSEGRMSDKLAALMDGPIPHELDWRKVPNRVSSVKDQGNCGSCWAFSATGVLEGQEAVHKFSKMIPLSEQELVDCSPQNYGCKGGDMQNALEDVADEMKGIESEQDYPYTATDNQCSLNKTKSVLSIKGAHLLKRGDEQALLKAVANYGPVAVAMHATQRLMRYRRGIFNDYSCNTLDINHGVLVVGYGFDDRDGHYWIIKNSWGPKWGEGGYFRMKRDFNMCGIAEYPTLADF